MREGDTTAANAAFDEVLGWLAERERGGETSYQLFRERAAIHALRGNAIEAVRSLQTAYDRGFRLYGAWSPVDPMLASVVQHPEIIALTERMRQDVRLIRRRLGLASEVSQNEIP